jgi:uncharacterized protein YciI
MYILILKYKSGLNEIDDALPAHVEYLNKYYALGKFICSGAQNPRVGGVIVCTAKDRAAVDNIIAEDPFYVKKLADYEVIEFLPTMYADELKPLLG